jgi:hypothetical protein
MSFYSRKPVVFLSAPPRQGPTDTEKGDLPEAESGKHEDALDRHVEDVLARPSKFRRTIRGVWSFLKTRMLSNSLSKSLNLPSLLSSALGVSRTLWSSVYRLIIQRLSPEYTDSSLVSQASYLK